MTITATVIADSISEAGKRITTLQLRYPRFIHSEFMTHRMFSRNASSSRAIPVTKMIEDLKRDPAMPIHWGSNKPGMQAGDSLHGIDLDHVQATWLQGMERAIGSAERMMELGLHKQIANRILEPWAHINVVVTATEFANFFKLRRHADAQPEIQELAQAMWHQMQLSQPVLLHHGDWHLPYADRDDDFSTATTHLKKGRIIRSEPMYTEIAMLLRKVSTARCGRVSYLTHDGRKTTIDEDLDLFAKLVVAEPMHASPAEHQATPDECLGAASNNVWEAPALHGNFVGWKQHRKMLPGEFIPG